MNNNTEMHISDRRNWRYYLIVPALSVVLLLFAHFTTGLRTDHLFLIILVNAAFYVSGFSRRLITGLGVIIFYWVLFDSMKAWPNYLYNTVNIESLYDHEKNLFGFYSNGILITPNEYFIKNTSAALDVAAGIFYLCWVPLPLIFSIYLYSVNKNLFLRFCFAFLIVNLIGFVIYYLYPAAPPWYVAEHGMKLNTATKSYAAGLLRFDHYFGITLFEGMYAKGSNVFAAMPSLHASYPLIGLYYSFRQPLKWIRVIFFVVMPGIWFSAVYLTHHYVLDVLAGITCGITGILLFEKVIVRSTWFGTFLNYYHASIEKKDKKNIKAGLVSFDETKSISVKQSKVT